MKNTAFSASAYKKQTAELVTLPSGAEFLLRKVSLQTYLRNGRLPEALFQKIFDKWKIIDNLAEDSLGTEIAKDLSEDEVSKMLLFQADVVKSVCVEPKLVVDATNDDELDPNDLTEEDFNFIFSWAVKGGEQAQALGKFR